MAFGTIMNAMCVDNKDVNSAISPYFWFNILVIKRFASFFFIVCLLLHPFFEKKMDDAHAPNVGFYYALFRCVIDAKRHLSVYYMSKLCIIRKKICVWATPRCVRWWPDTSRSGNWAVIKKEADNTFVLSPMRTHCWFKVLLRLKYKQAFGWPWLSLHQLFLYWGKRKGKDFNPTPKEKKLMCR